MTCLVFVFAISHFQKMSVHGVSKKVKLLDGKIYKNNMFVTFVHTFLYLLSISVINKGPMGRDLFTFLEVPKMIQPILESIRNH